MKDTLKVGISGVRGIVGRALTPQIVASFARAFGSFVGRGPVVVGRDTRPTGHILEHAAVAGLQSVGCKPILAGAIPTPTVLYLTKDLRARGGICITASHNPVEWNALKFAGPDGLFLDPRRTEEFIDLYHQRDFDDVAEESIPDPVELPNATDSHLRAVRDFVNLEAIRARRFKVAVDGVNGVGALHSRPFLESLGCEVIEVHATPDGRFEREAEPRPQALGVLAAAVRENGCDIGFAQDPDGDRLTLVPPDGVPANEEIGLALSVWNLLAHHRRGTVIVNLSTGKRIDAVASWFNCPVERTRIGEIHVSSRMVETRAAAGGEANGGIIVPDIHPCRDSFAGMALILELLVNENAALPDLIARLPDTHIVRHKLPVRNADVPRLLRHIRKTHERQTISQLDGVHVDFGDRWLHVRPSNTEPVLRVTTEAPTPDAAESLNRETQESLRDIL